MNEEPSMHEDDTQESEEALCMAKAAGKCLTFSLGDEVYGIPILNVREIIGLLDITPVPQTAPWTRGVVNLRGKIIPVVDLRARLAMATVEPTDKTCIIVVLTGTNEMGMIVDSVSEVTNIPIEALAPPPNLGFGAQTEYLLAVGRMNGAVQLVLNIDRVLSEDQMAELQRTVG